MDVQPAGKLGDPHRYRVRTGYMFGQCSFLEKMIRIHIRSAYLADRLRALFNATKSLGKLKTLSIG